MARISVESARTVINSLLSEQERDKDHLVRMRCHSEKMTEHLTQMRDGEESRIDQEAQERKAAVRRLFGQLLSVEEERRQRLDQHLADIEGHAATRNGEQVAPARKGHGPRGPQRQ